MNAPETRQLVSQQTATFDLSPRTFQEALTFSEYLANSDMVPKAYRGKPGDCLIAVQWGAEVGLKPLQALQSIAAINGKPSLYGDAGKALLLSHGCIIEEDDIEVIKAHGKAACTITRPGRPPVRRTFSLEDAKTAGLLGKEGPWRAYQSRQMAWRAFWFAARDAAADLLRGMGGFEEAIDMPAERHMGPVDEVPKQPEKPALPAYPQADFDTNMPKWQKLIDDGKGTAQALLAKLSTKAVFSEEQKTRILSMKPKAVDATPAPPPADEHVPPLTRATTAGEHDDFIAAMEADEDGVIKS